MHRYSTHTLLRSSLSCHTPALSWSWTHAVLRAGTSSRAPQVLRRLGKTDGVACTAQHVQVHLLHRLQVKGGVGLCGVDEEGPQRIGFAFGTRCSSAISQNQSGLMDIWAAFRLVLVQVKCTAAPVFIQSFVYACGSASTLAKVSRDEFEAWPPTCLTLAMPLTLRVFLALLPNRIL